MFEQLHSGEIYFPNADEILEIQFQCMERLWEYNATRPSEQARRERLLREMFAEIGAGAVILPGVTIGDDTVIGAGSVVTKDIPAGVVAVGNPCRVLRPIGEHDREFYFRDRRIPPTLLNR